MIEVFCSCAPSDQEYLEELVLHLKLLEHRQLIKLWESYSILPGADWVAEHDKHLNSAQVILFLISPEFLTSSFHMKEVQVAMGLREQGRAYVIPILLRQVSLKGTSLGQLEPLPARDSFILGSKSRNHRQVIFQVAKRIEHTMEQRFWIGQEISAQDSLLPVDTLLSGEQPFDQRVFEEFKKYMGYKLEQFRKRLEKHRRAWNRRKIFTGGVAVLTWLLVMIDLWTLTLTTSPLVQFTLIFLTAVAATSEGIGIWSLAQAYDFSRWLHYQRQIDEIKNEQRMYEDERGIYALKLDKQRVFRERVSDIIRNTGGGTRSDDETRDYYPF